MQCSVYKLYIVGIYFVTHPPFIQYLPSDGDGLGVQHVEHSGGQPVSSILGQPTLAGKLVFEAPGGRRDGQFIHQPAALRSGSVMAQLGGKHTVKVIVTSRKDPTPSTLSQATVCSGCM